MVLFSHKKIRVYWLLERDGNFTTASLYRELMFPEVRNKWMEIWNAKLPLKIIFFLWQVYNDKIQSAEQLKKRNWRGDIECKLCGLRETIDHIIFGCALARFVWCVFRDWQGWQYALLAL